MQLKCLNRKVWVAATPEEIVRQSWLHRLDAKGFPKSLTTVEKELSQLAHLHGHKVPSRRADILCFGNKGDTLVPLLLIECKAVPITQKAMTQAIAYNYYIQAPYLAIANKEEIRFGWIKGDEGYVFLPHLPSFHELR